MGHFGLERRVPAVVPLAELACGALDRLLDSQRDAYAREFGSALGQAVEMVRVASRRGELSGFVEASTHPAGYVLVVRSSTSDVLASLWVDADRPELARALVERARLDAQARRRRLEAQDLLFGETDWGSTLSAESHLSRRRFYMTSVCEATRSTAGPKPAETRSFAPGDLLSSAALSRRAFAGSPEPELASSYLSHAGCVERLSSAVQSAGFGELLPDCSPVVEDDAGRLLGFALVTRLDRIAAHLVEMAVAPEARGRGLGELLLRRSLQSCHTLGLRSMSLCVTERNAPALRLYKRNGFHVARCFRAHVLETGKSGASDGQNLPRGQRLRDQSLGKSASPELASSLLYGQAENGP